MGIPGLLKEIGKGERLALSKLAIEHFEKTSRPLRIAIDAAIWQFQQQAGQGGKNPALRTLFFRLLRLLALPIHPVFVYDGKNKPKTKRGKTVSRYTISVEDELSKNLVGRFKFPFHTAPGEAEAECAFLQKNGIVDAVMSQDVDAIMFGSTSTLRDWSKEGTKGNKAPTHVNVLDAVKIKERTGLDSDGMILVALLNGGDYDEGLAGFGPAVACEVAKAGFAADLFKCIRENDELGLREWRERLQYELHTNESGYFSKKHKTLMIPEGFPNRNVLSYYLEPVTSRPEDLKTLERRWTQRWEKEIDIPALREYTAMTFDWMYVAGARRFIRCLAQPLFQHRLKRRVVPEDIYTLDSITEMRRHFMHDGMPELRFRIVPADVVELNLDAEEENPEFAELDDDTGENDGEDQVEEECVSTQESAIEEPSSPSRKRKRPPWDPRAPEKWWIPRTLLQYGLPAVVEEWHQKQRDIMADPKQFATRKCPKPLANKTKILDHSMKQNAIKSFFPVSKDRTGVEEHMKHFNTEKSKPVTDSKHVIDLVVVDLPSDDVSSDQEDRSDIKTHDPSQLLERSAGIPSIPSFVTHRKNRRPRKSDEVVIVSTKKALKPMSAFFGSRAGAELSRAQSPAASTVPGQDDERVLECQKTRNKSKKLAVPRDSLPGTWRELTSQSSGGSRISFVNLIDD